MSGAVVHVCMYKACNVDGNKEVNKRSKNKLHLFSDLLRFLLYWLHSLSVTIATYKACTCCFFPLSLARLLKGNKYFFLFIPLSLLYLLEVLFVNFPWSPLAIANLFPSQDFFMVNGGGGKEKRERLLGEATLAFPGRQSFLGTLAARSGMAWQPIKLDGDRLTTSGSLLSVAT